MENQAELTRMMQTYGTQLLRLCTLYLKDRMLAEDAVQETFVRAWRADFRQECSEKTFLTRIAINICKNYLRTPWHTRRASAELLDQLTTQIPDIDDTLLRAVLSLSQAHRAVILLYYYQGFSVNEISEILSIPSATVSTRLFRARKKLRLMLKEWYYDEP